MSALQNQVRVMRTLIAPTMTVRTAVLVNRGSLEMEQSAQVHLSYSKDSVVVRPWSVYINKTFAHRGLLFNITSFSLKTDIDECSADSSPCDENADCTNTDGSYSCSCKQGFDGDGTTCRGMLNTIQIYSKEAMTSN